MTVGEEQTFTILLIDDHYENRTQDIDSIIEHIETKDVTPKILCSKNGEDVHEYNSVNSEFSDNILSETSEDAFFKFLFDNDIDIILTDKNLGKTTGNAIIQRIRGTNPVVDILYYSGVIEDSDRIELGKFISVDIMEERLFVPTLKKIVDKNLAKWDEIIFLRGIVISHTVDVEAQLDEFFTKFFEIKDHATKHFDAIVRGTSISLEAKRQILSHVIDEFKVFKPFKEITADIKKAQDERNILAHSKLHPTLKNTFISKENETFTKTRMITVLKRIENARRGFIEINKILDSTEFREELKSKKRD